MPLVIAFSGEPKMHEGDASLALIFIVGPFLGVSLHYLIQTNTFNY